MVGQSPIRCEPGGAFLCSLRAGGDPVWEGACPRLQWGSEYSCRWPSAIGSKPPPTFGSSMLAGPRQSTLSRVIGNSRPRLPVVRRVRVRYHRALVRHRARGGHGRNRYAGGNRSVDKTVPDTGESGSYACAGGGKHQARCMIQCGNKVNVGGGLLPIAVDQPTYAWTETPPSGASPLPHLDLQCLLDRVRAPYPG